MLVRDERLLGRTFRIESTVSQSRLVLFIGVAFGARRVVELAYPFFEFLLADPGPGVPRAAVAPVPDEVHRADSVGEGAPVAGIRQRFSIQMYSHLVEDFGLRQSLDR